MQQKVFLIGEIYLFCIYFSLNNFNYPNKKLAIPSKLRNSSAEFPQHSREKKKLAWVLGADDIPNGRDAGVPDIADGVYDLVSLGRFPACPPSKVVLVSQESGNIYKKNMKKLYVLKPLIAKKHI